MWKLPGYRPSMENVLIRKGILDNFLIRGEFESVIQASECQLQFVVSMQNQR